MPLLFFTQLMGIAFGEKAEDLGFGSEFVSASEAMSRIGVKTPEPVKTTPSAKKPSGLPMPPPLNKVERIAETTEEANR